MTLPHMNDLLSIDSSRFLATVQALAQIGLTPDRPGVTRRAFSPEMDSAKGWLIAELESSGLSWRMDGAGNLIARYGGDGSAVATGSHLDTVPSGGHLDGALGVLAGLEVLRRFSELNLKLRHPVELIAFTDEEGRFGSMIGSKCMSGTMSQETLRAAHDEAGRSLERALSERGLSVESALSARREPQELKAFVELHIEQGPVLDTHNADLGVVEEIVGIIRWRARLLGEANHAGTTPMSMRRDAFVGLTQIASELPTLLNRYGSPAARATIGEVEIKPGYMGVIPAEVAFSVDMRDISQPHLDRFHAALRAHAEETSASLGLTFEVEPIGQLCATRCDPKLVQVVSSVIETLSVPHISLPSGATHDALPMSNLCPTAMIFVPSAHGVSHSPHEHTEERHLALGARALLNTLYELTRGE